MDISALQLKGFISVSGSLNETIPLQSFTMEQDPMTMETTTISDIMWDLSGGLVVLKKYDGYHVTMAFVASAPEVDALNRWLYYEKPTRNKPIITNSYRLTLIYPPRGTFRMVQTIQSINGKLTKGGGR